MPWGTPARALLATPCRPASCHIASWSCSALPPPPSPSLGGACVADRIFAPGAWSALYGPLFQRPSARIAHSDSPQGVDHKASIATSKSAKAMTGPVIGSRDIYGLNDVEISGLVSFSFSFALRKGAIACESSGLLMLQFPNIPYLGSSGQRGGASRGCLPRGPCRCGRRGLQLHPGGLGDT